MKNREKYIDEIITTAVNGTCCKFMLDKVMPNFIDSIVNVDNLCEDGNCNACSMLFALWLDEEYTEPPKPIVDWGSVPVDTLVRVRNKESEDWRLMYFKELRTDYVFNKHITWKDGKTSKTAEGDCVGWQYCELVEDVENE